MRTYFPSFGAAALTLLMSATAGPAVAEDMEALAERLLCLQSGAADCASPETEATELTGEAAETLQPSETQATVDIDPRLPGDADPTFDQSDHIARGLYVDRGGDLRSLPESLTADAGKAPVLAMPRYDVPTVPTTSNPVIIRMPGEAK